MDYIEKAKFWAENPCFDIETQEEARKLLKVKTEIYVKILSEVFWNLVQVDFVELWVWEQIE